MHFNFSDRRTQVRKAMPLFDLDAYRQILLEKAVDVAEIAPVMPAMEPKDTDYRSLMGMLTAMVAASDGLNVAALPSRTQAAGFIGAYTDVPRGTAQSRFGRLVDLGWVVGERDEEDSSIMRYAIHDRLLSALAISGSQVGKVGMALAAQGAEPENLGAGKRFLPEGIPHIYWRTRVSTLWQARLAEPFRYLDRKIGEAMPEGVDSGLVIAGVMLCVTAAASMGGMSPTDLFGLDIAGPSDTLLGRVGPLDV